MYSFRELDKEELWLYCSLVPPSFSNRINRDWTAIVAFFGSQPIGICIVKNSELKWIFVEEQYRRFGIGRELIQWTCKNLEAQKKDKLLCNIHNLGRVPPSFLISCNFNKTEEVQHAIFNSKIESIENWIKNRGSFKLHPDYHILSWKELSEQKKTELSNRLEQNHPMSPFFDEDLLECSLSFWLCNQNGVVGWITAHRYVENTVTYSRIFVEKFLRNEGYDGILVNLALVQHLKYKERVPFAEFWVNTNNTLVLQLCKSLVEKKILEIRPELNTTYFFEKALPGISI